MKQLIIDEAQAKHLYPTAAPDFKKKLEAEFGKEFFNEPSYETIKSYEDACASEGVDPIENLPYKDPKTIRQKKLNLVCKIETVATAINKLDGFVPDFEDPTQHRYEPIFKKGTSGFVFSHSDCDHWYAGAAVGARLCVFRNSTVSKYMGVTFQPLFNELLSLK